MKKLIICVAVGLFSISAFAEYVPTVEDSLFRIGQWALTAFLNK
jgi:hypothetical protein